MYELMKVPRVAEASSDPERGHELLGVDLEELLELRRVLEDRRVEERDPAGVKHGHEPDPQDEHPAASEFQAEGRDHHRASTASGAGSPS